jgi:hypothetical protein
MAITPPPTPPNTGNPAQLEERADAFFGWFPTFVADYNADLPLLRGKTYSTRGGTANAITLNTGGVALATGMQVRWRAAAANTGPVTINVDGQGAIEARTITNVALPAGYIRTDADTVATYDGTRWIVDRQIESGINANGAFQRTADGTLLCWGFGTSGTSADTPATFPAVFVASNAASEIMVSLGINSVSTAFGLAARFTAMTTTGLSFAAFRTDTQALISVRVTFIAVGRWY